MKKFLWAIILLVVAVFILTLFILKAKNMGISLIEYIAGLNLFGG